MLRCITEYNITELMPWRNSGENGSKRTERKSLKSNFKRCSCGCFESFVYDGKGLGGEYGTMGFLQSPEIKEILSRTYAVTRFMNRVAA